MKGIVVEGEELMKHRQSSLSTSGGNNHAEMPARGTPGGNQDQATPAASGMSGVNNEPEMQAHTTPIRKLCRNRGLVTLARQDETVTPGTCEVKVMEDKHMSPQDESSVTGTLIVAVVEDKEMVKEERQGSCTQTYKRRRLERALFQDKDSDQ